MVAVILKTQAATNEYLQKHVQIGQCVEATFAPEGWINLEKWIAPHECCGSCGHIYDGLRIDEDGHVVDECVECGDSLITTWGDAQTERWESGERYGDPACENDDGPQVGPIRVVGGDEKFIRALKRQADRALIKFEDAREPPVGPWTGPPGFVIARAKGRGVDGEER